MSYQVAIMAQLMADPTKIKIKLGNAEFEADGPSNEVQEYFRRFMEAVAALPKGSINPDDDSGRVGDLGVLGVMVNRELFSRVFQESDNAVSLRVRPQTA